jgi:hypothetical protein
VCSLAFGKEPPGAQRVSHADGVDRRLVAGAEPLADCITRVGKVRNHKLVCEDQNTLPGISVVTRRWIVWAPVKEMKRRDERFRKSFWTIRGGGGDVGPKNHRQQMQVGNAPKALCIARKALCSV